MMNCHTINLIKSNKSFNNQTKRGEWNMRSINKDIVWVFLCTFALLFQGCGSTAGSGSSSTSASAKDVTVSGTMSQSGTSSSIIDHGVLSLAASSDDYKLYCVTFTEPALAS